MATARSIDQPVAEVTDHEVTRALATVAVALPGGGEVRSGQQHMALAVAAALESGHHLVVQAGTGTGKSLGYLVPSILSGKKVVVATATKALQDQLAGKDLPFLEQYLGTRFTFSVLKGRSNYYCVQRALELRATIAGGSGQLRMEGTDTAAPAAMVEEITTLAQWAATSTVGDRAELEFEPSPSAWGAVSVSAAECPGAAKCPSGESCFAEKARQRAAQSDVVVVNMHLYGQHVRSGGFVLPEHDVVILDEAHEIEDIIADSLGVEISGGRFVSLSARVRAVVADSDKEVDLGAIAPLLDAALSPFAGNTVEGGPGNHAELRRVLNLGIGRARQSIDMVRKAVPDSAPSDTKAKASRAMQAAGALVDELENAVTMGAPVVAPPAMATPANTSGGGDTAGGGDTDEKPDGRIAWVEQASGGRGPVLRISPVEVGPALHAGIWSKVTAVLTSATIPQRLRERLGMEAGVTEELDVGSPFDFATQGRLYCAVNLPDPRHADYEAAMHAELRALITAAGGRTLALFTSWKAMRAAHQACVGLPFTMLAQGELPKPVLTSRFASEETSCLFATMGFWQGIDVPGRTLSLVVIDKLPFGRPDEPLLMARREKAGAQAFSLIDLPKAATLLAQGTGRLIRTRNDRGVVAILDPRLNTARYRWDLIKALPPFKRTRSLTEVEEFLRHITT